MEKYKISYEMFKEVMKDLKEEEITFCYNNLRYKTARNTLFLKCFEYARQNEKFLNITDSQHFYIVSIKDYENEFEPHPEFRDNSLKVAVFKAIEYIVKLKN